MEDDLAPQPIPCFQFHVVQRQPESFQFVEQCVLEQLQADQDCGFLRSAAFAHLRRQALYETRHTGAVAFTGHGLCVKLFPDNRVVVKWN